jgi:malonyl-ACP decarboxylase
MGVCTAIGSSVNTFAAALRVGATGVRWAPAGVEWRPAALLDDRCQADIQERATAEARRVLRSAPPATQLACGVAVDAIRAARLVDARAAIVVGGNNIHQRYSIENYQRFLDRPRYLNPRYAVSFLVTFVVGALSEVAGLRGPGLTAGGSMASGNVALYQAFHLLRSGAAKACVCVGAMADYGDFEFQAFTNLGALHPTVVSPDPEGPGAPFDRRRSGFVYGQGSGCVVLETEQHARERGASPLAELAGASLLLDGHAASEPNPEGEASAMIEALSVAGLTPADVDYVNAHATATPAGDEAECEAIGRVFEGLPGPWINATKELTGHTMYAAGIVECIATVLQMEGGFLHPNPKLSDPIDAALRFVGPTRRDVQVDVAVSNSFSVGGINSAVVLRRWGGEAS